MSSFTSSGTRYFFAALTLFAALPVSGQNRGRAVGDLARNSEIIAVGKITGTKSGWDRSHNRIVTSVTMNVEEYLKGNAGNVLTITAMGGEVDGVGEWYSHTAKFKTDEEVVIFGSRDGEGKLRVTGGEGGKVRIERESKTGTAVVQGNRTLTDFKREVSEALQARGGK